MAPRYQPPTRVSTKEIPYLALVTQFDPDFERAKHRVVEYEFDHKVYVGDPYSRGVYSRLSSVYPVGAPYGGLDPLIQEGLEPTVGNAVPGLYEGIDDGMGWA